MEILLQGEALHLLPERAVWWPGRHQLIIADAHFGKVGHFRKNGIPVPTMAREHNFWKLSALLQDYPVREVVFLGDLFHSHLNEEIWQFGDFRENFEEVQFHLVRGNHDILPNEVIGRLGLEIHEPNWHVGPFIFNHEPPADLFTPQSQYMLCGHIHPAVVLKGRGKQHLRLPCFYFGTHVGILPAFGDFTGLSIVQPKQGDLVYAALQGKVAQL
jgi:DNA ligase-associated metallophosphoesterase